MRTFQKFGCLVIALGFVTFGGAEATAGTSLLGTPTRLVMSCKDVITSLTWWSRLGFLPVEGKEGKLDSAVTLTDGQLNITLTSQSLPSPIIMFRTENIKALKDTLDVLEIETTNDVDGPSFGELRLLSPNGIHIAVRATGRESLLPVSGDSNRLCGKNTELSIGTGFLKRETTYWETLGFAFKRQSREPYPFALMTDTEVTIGMHENRDITVLTLTYFAENMSERIKNIKAAGIQLDDQALKEEAKVNSAMLTSPDGQRVFLFTGNQ